jgi:hypothetical protein
MQMRMKHHLSALAIDVHGHAVAGQPVLAGYAFRSQE